MTVSTFYYLLLDQLEGKQEVDTINEGKATATSGKPQEQLYHCCICYKHYPSIPCMIRHIKYHVSRTKCSKPEHCRHCDKVFTTRQQLTRHEAIHTDIRPFKCEKCGKLFKTADSVKRHMYVHSDERPFSCQICNKEFKAKHLMKKHEETHSDAKNYECPKCGKKFKARNSLRDHLLVHNGTRPYKCDVCNQAFYRRSHLATHKTVHSELKPFTCNHCGKSFGRREHLKVHERIHSGEKPFQCDQCERSFNQQAGLQAHRVSHSDERPYTCLTCKKSFKYQSQIKHHACKPDEIGPCMASFRSEMPIKEVQDEEATPTSNSFETPSLSQEHQSASPDVHVTDVPPSSEAENTIILIQIENASQSEETAMSVDLVTTDENKSQSNDARTSTVANVDIQLALSEPETTSTNTLAVSDLRAGNIATATCSSIDYDERYLNMANLKSSSISQPSNIQMLHTNQEMLAQTCVNKQNENSSVDSQMNFTSACDSLTNVDFPHNVTSTHLNCHSTTAHIFSQHIDNATSVDGSVYMKKRTESQPGVSVNKDYTSTSHGIPLEVQNDSFQAGNIVLSQCGVNLGVRNTETAVRNTLEDRN